MAVWSKLLTFEEFMTEKAGPYPARRSGGRAKGISEDCFERAHAQLTDALRIYVVDGIPNTSLVVDEPVITRGISIEIAVGSSSESSWRGQHLPPAACGWQCHIARGR